MGLTDLQIKRLRPKGARYEVTDGKGLCIRVKPTGDKAWFYRYRFDGKLRIMTLGQFPGISLAEARKRHAEAMQKLQGGTDPGLEAKAARAKRKAAPTFKDLLDEFTEMELKDKPTGSERRRLVAKDALPKWKNRPVASITRRDAVLLIDGIRKRAPIGANRVQGVLVRMFNFASERGIIEFSPLAGMRRGKEKPRARVLTDDEIKSFWNALSFEREDIDIYRLTKLALKAILLTGQRPGEVAGMAWKELEGDFWNIPAERMKGKEPQRVPINPMLREIIDEARNYSHDCPFVFRSSHDNKKHVTVGAIANSIRRHSAEMKIDARFTPHDLRRTLRTRLAELGVSDVVAERVLGHKLQGILGVYNRHSYDVEKRQALAMWERRLSAILGHPDTPSNVLQFEVRNGKAI